MGKLTPAVLINIGETIPDMPDIRVGTFMDEHECISMGEFDCPEGGYLVWNTAEDWFVVPVDQVIAEASLPSEWRTHRPAKAEGRL